MEDYKLPQAIEHEPFSSSRVFLNSRRNALQTGALALVFFYLYASVWMALATTWWVRDDYSYGFLVPLISLYLVWNRRKMLMRLPVLPAYQWGLPVMLAAGAMLVIGKAGNVITLQELSLVLMIAGIVLCLFGKNYLKALGFPIAYLLFMVPIADELIAPLHWSFQLLTAKMGVAFLQALGFTALLDHQYIFLPSITLEVAKACSGINYLISIIALGMPLAYLTQKNTWCSVVLVVSAVIIGIMGNWIRVAAIGIWAYYGGQVVHGPFHVFQSLFVSQIGFVALFAGSWALSKIPAAASGPAALSPVRADWGESGVAIRVASDIASGVASRHGLPDRSWLGVFLVLILLSVYFFLNERGPVPLKVKLATFPITIGDWKSQENDLRDVLFRVEGADQELMRIYRDPAGHEVQLYVAYFESQHHPKKLFNYATTQLHHDAVPVDIQIFQNKSIAVNRTRIPNEYGERPVFFWYDLNGKTYSGRQKAVLASTLDALMHGRTNGALVLIVGNSADPKDDKNMFKEESAFIGKLAPVLQWYLPDGKDNADTRRN